MSLFTYPSTLPARQDPKRHVVKVPDDATSTFQITLDRGGSRGFSAGQSVELTDSEYEQIDPEMFSSGLLEYQGAITTLAEGVAEINFEFNLEDIEAGTLRSFAAPFDGHFASARFVVTEAATTAAKAATLGIQINDDPVGVNEAQTLTEGGSGLTSFTITFDGETTASIDDDATAAQVKAALEALDNIGVGDVDVTGGPLGTGPFTVTFQGALAGTNVALMTTTPTGGTGTVVVALVSAGGSAVTVALTSAAATPVGKVINSTGTPTNATFSEGDTIEIEASAVTAFVEGAGVLQLLLVET